MTFGSSCCLSVQNASVATTRQTKIDAILKVNLSFGNIVAGIESILFIGRSRSEMNRVINYLRNSRAELGRVTWPTRSEVFQSTQATLVFVLLTVAFLLVADKTLGSLIGLIT